MQKLLRLQKYISSCGICSRRAAEGLIASGRVLVNGKSVPETGILVDPEKDVVSIDGVEISEPTSRICYLLNKPIGYTVSLSDQHALHLVTELLPPEPRVFPIGRLDRDSSGLLLLTNDGNFANRLIHPSFEHEKEYEVYAKWKRRVLGNIEGKRLLQKLINGVNADGEFMKAISVEPRRFDGVGVLFRIVLTEGRKREVRKMCDSIGLDVSVLTRIRIASLTLGTLLPGEYRLLTPEEMACF